MCRAVQFLLLFKYQGPSSHPAHFFFIILTLSPRFGYSVHVSIYIAIEYFWYAFVVLEINFLMLIFLIIAATGCLDFSSGINKLSISLSSIHLFHLFFSAATNVGVSQSSFNLFIYLFYFVRVLRLNLRLRMLSLYFVYFFKQGFSCH